MIFTTIITTNELSEELDNREKTNINDEKN